MVGRLLIIGRHRDGQSFRPRWRTRIKSMWTQIKREMGGLNGISKSQTACCSETTNADLGIREHPFTRSPFPPSLLLPFPKSIICLKVTLRINWVASFGLHVCWADSGGKEEKNIKKKKERKKIVCFGFFWCESFESDHAHKTVANTTFFGGGCTVRGERESCSNCVQH